MAVAIEIGRRGDPRSGLEGANSWGGVKDLVGTKARGIVVQEEVCDAYAFNLWQDGPAVSD